jgi:FAD synthetase
VKAALHGNVASPAVAVIGVWDPFGSAHRQLFEQLGRRARETGLSSLAIMLDPHPASFREGASKWPVYDDVAARVRLILDCGTDGVLLVRFARKDADAGAAALFGLALSKVELAEIWLGFSQTLGRGPAGSRDAITALARQERIRVEVLRPANILDRDVRSLLEAGRIAEAGHAVGRPPVWRRPRSGRLGLAWKPGRYAAVPLSAPNGRPEGRARRVQLRPAEKGMAALAWPDGEIVYLAFVAGPADVEPAAPVFRADQLSLEDSPKPLATEL